MQLLWRALPFIVLISVLSATVYVVTLQYYRQTLDDPQVQVSLDVSLRLEAGADPKQYIPSQKHDLARSLSTFVSIYDGNQTLIGSSGLLEGSPVTPGSEYFNRARETGVHRFSWAPRSDVRIAAVMRHVTFASTSSYVLVGRTVRETEGRMATMGVIVFVGWITTLCATVAAIALSRRNLLHDVS